MIQNIKIDTIYYLTNSDFEMEFNLGGCCKMRLLTDKSESAESFVKLLARAVSRSQVILCCGKLFEDDGLINIVSKAIKKPLVDVDKSAYSIEDANEIKIIDGAVPLVNSDGCFCGCILESGPQSIILLTENRGIRKTVMKSLIHPYIEELSILMHKNSIEASLPTEEPVEIAPEVTAEIIPPVVPVEPVIVSPSAEILEGAEALEEAETEPSEEILEDAGEETEEETAPEETEANTEEEEAKAPTTETEEVLEEETEEVAEEDIEQNTEEEAEVLEETESDEENPSLPEDTEEKEEKEEEAKEANENISESAENTESDESTEVPNANVGFDNFVVEEDLPEEEDLEPTFLDTTEVNNGFGLYLEPERVKFSKKSHYAVDYTPSKLDESFISKPEDLYEEYEFHQEKRLRLPILIVIVVLLIALAVLTYALVFVPMRAGYTLSEFINQIFTVSVNTIRFL